MDEECLESVLFSLNQWWKEEDITAKTLRARVLLMYKKGDTEIYENYRPISRFNAFYKIYAAIIPNKLANTLDTHLQKTSSDSEKTKVQQMQYR